MKLLGEIQYEEGRKNCLGDNYYTYISFSLNDVKEEDIKGLCQAIRSETYAFGLFGSFNASRKTRHFFSPRRKNSVSLDHFVEKGIANIFINGPKAEEIELEIMKLIPESDLKKEAE